MKTHKKTPKIIAIIVDYFKNFNPDAELSYRDLTEQLISKKLWTPSGSTPANTLNASLNTYFKTTEESDRLLDKPSSGVFKLKALSSTASSSEPVENPINSEAANNSDQDKTPATVTERNEEVSAVSRASETNNSDLAATAQEKQDVEAVNAENSEDKTGILDETIGTWNDDEAEQAFEAETKSKNKKSGKKDSIEKKDSDDSNDSSNSKNQDEEGEEGYANPEKLLSEWNKINEKFQNSLEEYSQAQLNKLNRAFEKIKEIVN